METKTVTGREDTPEPFDWGEAHSKGHPPTVPQALRGVRGGAKQKTKGREDLAPTPRTNVGHSSQYGRGSMQGTPPLYAYLNHSLKSSMRIAKNNTLATSRHDRPEDAPRGLISTVALSSMTASLKQMALP
eukprot:3836696-Amphidinium_carterae.1